MALSESGSGVKVGVVTYGSSRSRRVIRSRKGAAKGSMKVRSGGKQSFFVRPRGR